MLDAIDNSILYKSLLILFIQLFVQLNTIKLLLILNMYIHIYNTEQIYRTVLLPTPNQRF